MLAPGAQENRKMAWEEVEPVDFLTMTRTAIKRKYLKRRCGWLQALAAGCTCLVAACNTLTAAAARPAG